MNRARLSALRRKMRVRKFFQNSDQMVLGEDREIETDRTDTVSIRSSEDSRPGSPASWLFWSAPRPLSPCPDASSSHLDAASACPRLPHASHPRSSWVAPREPSSLSASRDHCRFVASAAVSSERAAAVLISLLYHPRCDLWRRVWFSRSLAFIEHFSCTLVLDSSRHAPVSGFAQHPASARPSVSRHQSASGISHGR